MTNPRGSAAKSAAMSAALSGAVDLSALKARADAARQQQAAPQGPPSSDGPASGGAVLEVTEATLPVLAEYLRRIRSGEASTHDAQITLSRRLWTEYAPTAQTGSTSASTETAATDPAALDLGALPSLFGSIPTEQRRKVARSSGHDGTILAAPSGPVKRPGH